LAEKKTTKLTFRTKSVTSCFSG